MGVISGTALSLTSTVSGVVMAAGGAPQHPVAGHVLLGVGLGLLLSTAIRWTARFIVLRTASRPRDAQAPAEDTAPAAVVPLHAARVVPLRGRHAA